MKRFKALSGTTAVVAVLILALCVPMAGAQGSTAPGVSKDSIKIGAFGPLTGPLSFVGLGTRDGIQLAFDEINAHGGVRGRKLELVYEQADTPADSVAAARKLVEQDKVFAMIVAGGSVGADAAAAYLRQAKVPSYNIVSLSPGIREPASPNIFHGVIPSAAGLSNNLVSEVLDRTTPKPKKVGILAATTASTEAYLNELKPMFDKRGTALTIERLDLGATNFSSQLLNFSRQNVEAILYLGPFQEAALAIKQAPDNGLANVPWILDGQAASGAVPAIAGAAANGIRSAYAHPYYPGETAPPMAAFDQAWRAKYGTPPPGRPTFSDLAGYGDAYVLAQVIKSAGKNPTWNGLIKAWETTKNASPSTFGKYGADVIFPESFSKKDHQGNKQVSTIQVQNGKWSATSASHVVE